MTQIKDNINVTIAMIEQANTILTFKKAKLTPIAKASILVAIANNKITFNGKSETSSFSFSSRLSLIIFNPIKASNIKATQWSTL